MGRGLRRRGADNSLVQAGLLCVPDKKSEAEKFFAQGLSIGKSENQRLGAVAQALHDSGIALGERKQEQTAMDYLVTALAIRFKETPESLKLVETLNALANLATVRAAAGDDAQRQYSLARDYPPGGRDRPTGGSGFVLDG